MQREHAAFGFLIPANAELFSYYAKFGYTPCFRFGWKTVEAPVMPDGVEVVPSVEPPLTYLRDTMQYRSMCVQHPLSDLQAVVDDMRLAGDTMWEARRGSLLVGVAICRVEDDGVLLRECLYDDDEARQALIAGIAAHYGRTEVDVIDLSAAEGEYFGMARVIDAEAMLTAYARLHPEADCLLNVADDLLAENNGCYRLEEGKCLRLAENVADAKACTIAELTHLVLAEENPLMTLMMND